MAQNGDPAKLLVCDKCRSTIFSATNWQAALGGKNGYSYRTTWFEIEHNAEKCSWCRLIHIPDREGEVFIKFNYEKEADITPAGENLMGLSLSSKENPISYAQYLLYTSSNNNAAKFVKARERITDIATPESYRSVLDCLEDCKNNHREKCAPPKPTILPERVIDCTDPKRPKIALNDGKRKDTFLTLSYVWGGPQPVTLKTSNLQKFATEGFQISDDAKTIQDAIQVTHNLGFRYLWIDALCIMQDSTADKARQLGSMRHIYRNSLLTISAACASRVSEGFLQRARPQKVPDALLPYPCPDGTLGSVWIAKDKDWAAAGDASRSYCDELEPVDGRGWCYQEKLLPARQLIFASDTLKYDCQTSRRSVGDALCEQPGYMRLPPALFDRAAAAPDPFSPQRRQQKVRDRQAWLSCLFDYSKRSISHAQDRLVAMSGVAEQFGLVFGGGGDDEYLAGLWRGTLLADLLWARSGAMTELAPRPEEYRAPTWSWAAVDGLIELAFANEEDSATARAEILECRVSLKSAGLPYGEVDGGILKLKAPLKKVSLDSSGNVCDGEVHGDSHGDSSQIGRAEWDAEEQRPEEAFVIPLLCDSNGASYVSGIVVVLVPGTVHEPKYQRIARFQSKFGSRDLGWMEGLSWEEITIV